MNRPESEGADKGVEQLGVVFTTAFDKFTASISPVLSKLAEVLTRLESVKQPQQQAPPKGNDKPPKQDAPPPKEGKDKKSDTSKEEVGRLNQTLSKLGAVLSKVDVSKLGSASGGGQEIGKAISGLGFGKLGAVVSQVSSGLEALVTKTMGFVQLLSPATIELFQQALNNVGATIGQAFLPLFTTLTTVARQIATVIQPAFAALQPVILQLSGLLGNYLVRYFRIMADLLVSVTPLFQTLLSALAPLFEVAIVVTQAFALIAKAAALIIDMFLKFSGITLVLNLFTIALRAVSGVLQLFSEVLSVVQIAAQALFDAFSSLFGFVPSVKSVMDQLTKAIQYVIKNFYILSIQIAKLFGLTSVVDGILKRLADKANTTNQVAQGPASIKTFEQIALDLAKRAATAGAGGTGAGIENEQAFWAATLADAKKAAEGQKTIQDILTEIKDAIVQEVSRRTVGSVQAAAVDAGNFIGDVYDGFTDGLGVIGRSIGRQLGF